MRAPYLLILTLATTFAVTGCSKKKDETPAPAPPPGGGGSEQIDFSPADASLSYAKNFHHFSGGVNTSTAASAFFMADGNNVEVGTVTLNGESLIYGPYGYSLIAPSVPMDNAMSWSVSGGNGFPAFNTSVSGTMPAVGSLTSSLNIQVGEPFTVSVSGVTNADFVTYGLYFGNNAFSINIPGNATSCTFPANITSAMEPGSSGFLTVEAVRRNRTTQEGKKVDTSKRAMHLFDVNVQ